MYENLVVLNRMNERITLLRAEVEKRGMRWADAEDEQAERNKDTNMTDADGRTVNGHAGQITVADSAIASGAVQTQSGRLTDEELRVRLADRLGEDEDDDGVHL